VEVVFAQFTEYPGSVVFEFEIVQGAWVVIEWRRRSVRTTVNLDLECRPKREGLKLAMSI